MPLQLEDLAALDAPTPESSGLPLVLPVDMIDEDPEQPRRDFEANRLGDLADTIRNRGVRQPISVRPHPQAPGRWMLNFGARRLRASKLAGIPDIPAFVDITADSYDQVIENEQREGLKPLDLALFVQKRIARGDKQCDIAQRLGKSRQWVTLTTALIEPPDWLLLAYREGRCRGLNELYELRRLHGEHGSTVERWAAVQPAITRDRLTELRERLDATATTKAPQVPAGTPDDVQSMKKLPPGSGSAGMSSARPTSTDTAPGTDQRVHVEYEGQDYQLVVSAVPDRAGCMYVRPLNGGPRRLAPVTSLKLLGFVGG